MVGMKIGDRQNVAWYRSIVSFSTSIHPKMSFHSVFSSVVLVIMIVIPLVNNPIALVGVGGSSAVSTE
jgi:hypothetical protein